MAILLAVVDDLQVETGEGAGLDEAALAVLFDEYTLFAETNARKELASTAKASVAVAFGLDNRCTLTQIAHDLLREHIPASLQTIGRLGVDGKESFPLCQTPMSVVWVVVPLPGGMEF